MVTTFKRHNIYKGTQATIEQALIETFDYINKTHSVRDYMLTKPHINEDNIMKFTLNDGQNEKENEVMKVNFYDNNEYFDIIFKNNSGVSIATKDVESIETYLEGSTNDSGKYKVVKFVYNFKDKPDVPKPEPITINGCSYTLN